MPEDKAETKLDNTEIGEDPQGRPGTPQEPEDQSKTNEGLAPGAGPGASPGPRPGPAADTSPGDPAAAVTGALGGPQRHMMPTDPPTQADHQPRNTDSSPAGPGQPIDGSPAVNTYTPEDQQKREFESGAQDWQSRVATKVQEVEPIEGSPEAEAKKAEAEDDSDGKVTDPDSAPIEETDAERAEKKKAESEAS